MNIYFCKNGCLYDRAVAVVTADVSASHVAVISRPSVVLG